MALRRSMCSHLVFRIILLALTAVSYSGTAWAAVGFQPVSPEELGMKSEPLAPGAPAIILYRQVDRDDNGSTSHEDNYYRIKILKEEGRKYADVEIPFLKQTQNVVGVHARTIRPDGSIVNFDGKVFDKSLVKARGLKYLAKTFTLPDVQVGGIIEYFYTVDFAENYVFDSHWILSDELFTKRAHFSLKPYSSYYSQFRLRWSWHSLPSGTVAPKEDPDHVVRMDASNIPAFQTEDFMPPENEMKSRIDFIYDDAFTETQPDKFWQHIGKKWNDTLESFVGKRKAMEAAVSQIVAPTDPPDAKLRKIYDRVQQIRNTSYEVSKTEQEEKRSKEKPAANVEDLWKRGYGNGVGLTWLFLGLTRAAGFEAYGCWVSNRREYFFAANTMQSQKLDTNVVLVKLDGKDVYFDPGAAFTPFGMLTWSETGTSGLCLNHNGGTWVRTALPESSASQMRRVAKLKLTDTGDLEGKVTVTFTGLEAMYQRLEERNSDAVERKKFLEDLVQRQIPAASQADLTNRPDWTSSETPLVAEFDLKIPGWASSAGKRVLLPVGVLAASEQHVFEHADRVHPIYFEYPFEKLDDLTIELPPGWHVDSVPKPLIQNGHVIVYESKTEENNGTLHLVRRLNVDILLLEQKYYNALRSFFQGVRTGDEEQIVLQPSATAAKN